MKKIFSSVIIIGLVVALGTAALVLFNTQKKIAAGYIYDCHTNQPLSNAEVSINDRGWGLSNGSLIWDKSYAYKAVTSERGFFRIIYKGNPTDMQAKKSGYIAAQQYEKPTRNIIIKMREGDIPGEVSYNCRLSSECLQATNEDGVLVTKNVCANLR